jgi:hypothetical protein
MSPSSYLTADVAYDNQELSLQRQLFLMWLFVAQEGVLDEARDFIFDHINDPFPFDPVA